MLIHSCIYYQFGESIISDKQFDTWAYELVDLQKQYPDIAAQCIKPKAFQDWDGTTGFNLPFASVPIAKKAQWLIDYHKHHK